MSDELEKSSRLKNARKRAEKLLEDPEQLNSFLEKTTDKASKNKSRLKRLFEDIQLLVSMLRAYKSGEYRKVPWKAIIYALAALVYFVNPIDLVPDFLVPIGFIDDATVLAMVVNALRNELDKFRQFLNGKPVAEIPAETADVEEKDTQE